MSEETVKILLILPESMKDQLDRISKKRRMSRLEVIRMMLELGIDCHKDLEKLGIVPVMDFFHFTRKSIKEKGEEFSKGKQLNLTD